LPLAQIATAVPRRRMNHIDASATSGAKVAELPSAPMSTPCASAKPHRLPDSPASTKPAARHTAPTSADTITPRRSASRPIQMPPMPKPTISSVYGSEASARATSNSACTAGSTTATMYMQLLPTVIRARVTSRRVQA